jgi:hypothetical protein
MDLRHMAARIRRLDVFFLGLHQEIALIARGRPTPVPGTPGVPAGPACHDGGPGERQGGPGQGAAAHRPGQAGGQSRDRGCLQASPVKQNRIAGSIRASVPRWLAALLAAEWKT